MFRINVKVGLDIKEGKIRRIFSDPPPQKKKLMTGIVSFSYKRAHFPPSTSVHSAQVARFLQQIK